MLTQGYLEGLTKVAEHKFDLTLADNAKLIGEKLVKIAIAKLVIINFFINIILPFNFMFILYHSSYLISNFYEIFSYLYKQPPK